MTSETRVLPRWSAIKPMARRFFWLTLAAILLIGSFMLTGSFWPSARSSFVLDSLLLAWMIVALVFPVGMLVLDWIKARASLLESETYLILFTVGIYLSMWFGLANYVSYFVNK